MLQGHNVRCGRFPSLFMPLRQKSGNSPPSGSRAFFVVPVLASLVLGGAYLRFHGLGVPSLWLDEILNYEIAEESGRLPPWAWLTGFERENGPLYFATLVAGQAIGSRVETAARMGAAVLGVAGLSLMAWAGWRVAGWGGALTATALLAVSPLHVVYSREGRTYALLMMLALVLCVGMLERHRRRGRWCLAGGSVLAAYTAATAAPLLASVTVVAAGLWLSDRRRDRKRRRRGALWGLLSGLGSLALVALLYGRFEPADPARAFTGEGAVRRWLTGFMVSGIDLPGAAADRLPPVALYGLALALLGLGVLTWKARTRDAALILSGMATLPALFVLAVLAWRDHWLSIRYLSPALPAFLLLVAVGLTELGRGLATGLESLPGRIRHEGRPPVAGRALGVASTTVATVLLVMAMLPATRTEPYRKPGWRRAAEVLAALGQEGEAVLTADDWTSICLGFYLERVPGGEGLEVLNLQGSVAVAERLARERETAWLASGGGLVTPRMRAWMRRFPQVAGEGLGGPRVFFRPDLATLAASRGDRALDPATFGQGDGGELRLRFDRSDPLFVGTGWSRPERGGDDVSFRWAVGRRAELLVPGGRGVAGLRLRARPFQVPDKTPQELEILVNGQSLGRFEMAAGWRSYEVTVPASVRQPSLDHLTLSFSRATAPADVRSGSRDRRRLAAAVDELRLSPVAAPAPPLGSGPPASPRSPP